MRSTFVPALLGLLVSGAAASAQPGLVGRYALEGRQGDRPTRVALEITEEAGGGLAVVRRARLLDEADGAEGPERVWRSGDVRRAGRALVVTYRLRSARGAADALAGRGGEPAHRFVARYWRGRESGLLREVVRNVTGRPPEGGWRVARARELPASEGTEPAPSGLRVTEGPGELVLQERELGVRVTFEPFRMRFLDGAGRDLGGQERHRGRDEDERPLAFESSRWHGPTRVEAHRRTGPGAWALDLATSDGDRRMRVALAFEAGHRLRVDATLSDAAGVRRFAEALTSEEGEGLYGGGERFDRVAMQDAEVALWTQHQHDLDDLSHLFAQARGQTDNCPVPLILSTRGYAVSFDTTARGELEFADGGDDRSVLVVEDDRLSYWVVASADPLRLVGRAAGCYGRARVPPKWFFAPHKWRDDLTRVEGVRGDRLLLEDAEKMREHAIPLGAVWLDNPWDTGFGDFEFRSDHFPDPDATIRALRAEGARLVAWASPYLAEGTDALAEARAEGYLIRDRAEGTHAMVDLTNPEAVAWWKARLKPLLRRGVMGIKADRGEEEVMGDDAVYHDGRPDRINHNRYPLLYARAVSEAVREVHGDEGVAIGRCGGAGAWRHWTALWTADNISHAGDPKGMRADVRAHITASLAGYPFVGGDAGGYIGLERIGPFHAAMPGPATLTRWVQFAAFTPLMQVGGQGPHEVWAMEHSRPGITAIYRRYATHHVELFPYLYELAQRAHATGEPLIRAMWLVDPTDVELRDLDDQYMLGDALLVAPVTEIERWGTVERDVRLPRGRAWIDLWTGARHAGGQEIERECDLATMPVYLAAGAILPLNFRDADLLGLGRSDLESGGLGLCFARGDASAERVLYDGTRVRLEGERLQVRGPAARRLGLKVFGPAPRGVVVGGERLARVPVEALARRDGWAHVAVEGGPGHTLVRTEAAASTGVAILR